MVTSEERRSKTVANESIHLLASTGIDCGDELEKEDEHEVDGKSSGDTELSCRSDENGDGHRKRKRSPYRMGTDPSQAFVSSPAPTSEGTSSVQYEKSSTAAASTDVAAHPPSKLKSLPQHSAGSGASTTTNTMTTTKTPAVNSMKKLNHRLFATSKKDRASSSPEQIVRKLPLGNRRRTTHPDDEDGGGGENNDSDDNNRDEPDLIYRGSIAHKVLEKVSNVDPTLLVDPDYLPTTSRNEHVFLDHNGTPVGGQLKRGKAKVEDEQRYGGQKHLNKDTNRGAAVLPTMISRIERKRSKQQEALRFSVEMPEVIFHPEVAQQKRRYRKGDLVTIKKQSHIIMVGKSRVAMRGASVHDPKLFQCLI